MSDFDLVVSNQNTQDTRNDPFLPADTGIVDPIVQPMTDVRDPSPFHLGRVNYADPMSSSLMPPFVRSRNLMTLDPDPFGLKSDAWTGANGLTSDGVLGLTVFGKSFSREDLNRSDAGRRLLKIADRNRTGAKRGFLDALTDFQWSDLPFFGLLASVGGSISDAVTVSDTMKKLQNGESVTDEELIKTRLFMAEQEYRENGTWGAMVGDIVRAAPGFMTEFLLSGAAFSALRTGLAKIAGKESVHFALTRAEKTLAREATDLVAKNAVKTASATGSVADFASLAAKDKRDSVISQVADKLVKFMTNKETALNPVLSGADDALIRDIAKKRAIYEFDKMMLRNSSDKAVVRGWNKFTQWAGRHVSSGLLDFGSWGTEEATVLTSSFTKARSALADAAGAMFVEAPIRGSLLMAPNSYLARPLIEAAFTEDGRSVSSSRLELEYSALLKDDPVLMADAESISSGINWLEYVSENAGRGFGSLARGVGLWLDDSGLRKAVRGIVRPAAEAAAGAGVNVQSEGFSIGGALRRMWKESIGSRSDFVAKSLDDKVAAVSRSLRSAGVSADDVAIRKAIQTNTTSGVLSSEAAAVIGSDMAAFSERAVRKYYDDKGKKHLLRYMFADFMTRHNIGPESLLNLYNKMGYDGILGEMMEERYSDVAKGMFGWNDVSDKDIATRLSEAAKGLWPGFSQLTAEAVGFAVPMVTRMGTARVLAKIGGEGKFARLRDKLEAFGDVNRAPLTWSGRIMDYFDVSRTTAEEQEKSVSDAKSALDKATESGDQAAIDEAQSAYDFAVRTRDRYLETGKKWLEGYAKSKNISVDSVEEWARENADELVSIEPLSRSEAETEGVGYVMRPVKENDVTAKAMQSHDNLVDFTPELMRILYDSDAPMEGESPSALRWVASKIVGIAGSMITGDYSLTFRDPASWISRDMGLGKDFVKSLKSKYLQKRNEVEARLRNEMITGEFEARMHDLAMYGAVSEYVPGSTFSVPEKYIDDLTQNEIAPEARRMMTSYLASQGVRSFSRSQAKDQAAALRARRLGYDIVDMESRTFAKSAPVVTETVPEVVDRFESSTNTHDGFRVPGVVYAMRTDTAGFRKMRHDYLEAKGYVYHEATESYKGPNGEVHRRTVRGYYAPDDGTAPAGFQRLDISGKKYVDTGATGDPETAYLTDPDFAKTVDSFLTSKGYTIDADGNASRIVRRASTNTTTGIDESSRVTFDEFFDKEKDEIYGLTNEISRATLDIIANRTSMSLDSRNRLMPVVTLPEGSDLERVAVYDAAMRLAGMANMVTTAQLRKDRTLEDTVRESEITSVSDPVVRAVYQQAMRPDGTFDPRAVRRELLESVAFSLGLRFDGTAKSLEERDRKIVEICALTMQVNEGKGDHVYFRIDEDPRISEPTAAAKGPKDRVSDPFVIVRADRSADGTLTVRKEFVPGAGEEVVTAASAVEMCERLREKSFNASIAPATVRWTQARVLTTDDPVVAMRTVGCLREYVERTVRNGAGQDDPMSYVHPMFRTDEDGNYVFTEAKAEAKLAEEVMTASNFDGTSLIRLPREGANAAEIAAATKASRAAWERVYGENGYLKTADDILSSRNVDVNGILGTVSGFSPHSSKYSMSLNTFFGRTADIFVPVDFNSTVDLKDSLLNARLLQAYALHPREVGNTFRKDIEGFLQELDKLVLVKIREATDSGKTVLADSLKEFRKSVTAPVVRFRDTADGKVRKIGVRITPQSFATLASTLCMFRDKRMAKDGFGQVPWVKAVMEIADDARNLSSYVGFEMAVDVVLGGTGFIRDRLSGEEGVPDSTGISGLMRVFHNDPVAVSKYASDYGFGGMSYTEFLDACDQKLKSIADRPVPRREVSKELRGKAASVRTRGDRTGLLRDLSKETGLSGPELREFVLSAIRLAHSLSPSKSGAEDRLATVKKAEDLAKKARARQSSLLQEYSRMEAEAAMVKTLDEQLQQKLRELADARAEVSRLKQLLDAGAARPQDVAESIKAAETRAATAAGDAAEITKKKSGSKSRMKSIMRALQDMGDFTDEDEDSSSDVKDAPITDTAKSPADTVRNAVNTEEEDSLPDLWSMYSGDGINGTALVELTDNELAVGTILSADDARKAASVVVRRILSSGEPVTYRSFYDGVVSLFRTLPSGDVRFMMEQYDSLAAIVENGSAGWNDIASSLTMRSISDDKDEAGGTDTSSEDQRIERDAVSELTGEDLKSFLSLARYVSPATGANLQAFVESVREFTRRNLVTSNADDILVYNLLNPMSMVEYSGTELKSDCDRDAVYAMLMKDLVDDPARLSRIIARMDKKSPATAFLLSYASAMVPGDRDRFMHLLANASSCDAYTRKMNKGKKDSFRMSPANPESKRVSQAAVAGSLSAFVGMSGQAALDAARMIEERFAPREDGTIPSFSELPDKLSALGYVDAMEKSSTVIADELAKFLGDGSPICEALRSAGLVKFLRRAVTAETKVRVPKGQRKSTYTKLAKAVARSMSVRRLYDASTNESKPGIAFVNDIVGALRVLGAVDGVITAEDAEAAAIAAFTAGDARQDTMNMEPRSSRVTNPICTFFGLYASSQPSTIMRADRDKGRSMKDSSVAITSRGVVPVVSRWMSSDGPNGFSAYVDKYFQDEVSAWMKSADARFIVDSRMNSDRSSLGDSYDEQASRRSAEAYAKKVFVGRCRQNMEWPDGTRILAKNITTTSYANELVAACTKMFVDNEDTAKYLVPLYSGDHSSSVMMQVPRKVLPDDIRKAHEDAVTRFKEYSGKPSDFTIDGLTKKEFARRTNSGTLPELYRRAATQICDAIGLDMLGKDAKRSAVSSMEQAGTSMRGAEVRDGKLVFGDHRLHIMFNYQSRKNARMSKASSQGNEDFKGMTMTVGYGAERQRSMAKLQGTNNLKLHLISASGRDLAFIKSLSSAPLDTRGEFYEKDCKRIIHKFLSDSIGASKIDSASLTDFDSYKVGPANAARIQVNGKPVIEFIVDELDRKYHLEDGGHLPADFDLETEFAGYTITESDRSDGVAAPKRMTDVLKGLRVTEISGLRGTTVSVSYIDNDMMAYSVANVSHESVETTGRTPRNYMTDASTMAMALLRLDPKSTNKNVQKDILKLISDWGLAATAVYGRSETISSLIRTSSGLRALQDAGESPDGIAMKEELFRTAWARMRENLNIPMDGVDAPLIATGAGVSLLKDADGNVMYDDRGRPMITCLSDSDMLRDINYGSIVFTDEEREFYGAPRRFGLAQVNVRERSFRYGWWLDEKEFDRQFMEGAPSTDKERLLVLERLFTDLRAAEQETGDDGKPVTDVDTRMKIASCFVDHHNVRISDYGEDFISCTLFEDLFRRRQDGDEPVFDRTAVQIDGDRVSNDATGRAHMFLGGTLFGIPRTPSYNGSKWMQIARASIPVDESTVEVTGKDGSKASVTVAGPNAAVAPDPLSNEILGCDNDGDKTKVYFLHGVGGHADFSEFPTIDQDGPVSDGDLERFGADPESRKAYYDRLVESGFVSEEFRPDGSVVRKISDRARHAASNRFVRGIFDMGHMLPCPKAGDRRVSFFGGIASDPTRAFPGSEACKDKLLKKKYPRVGSGPTIGDGHGLREVDLAADITTKAKDVSRGRARAVSLAKALHHAWQSGYFNGGRRNLFRGMDTESWFRFSGLYDGLPNSTFDDMKAQMCSRFGFTEGMMSVLTADFLLNHDTDRFTFGKIPTTEAEFDEIVTRYVDSVNEFGSHYYMMMAASEAYGQDMRLAIRDMTTVSSGVRSWADFFGVSLVTTSDGKSFWKVVDGSRYSDSSLPVGRYISKLVSDIVTSDDESIKSALKELGLTESGMLRMLAYSGRATSSTPGHLFWLAKELAGVDGTDDFAAIAKGVRDARIDTSSVSHETKLSHMKKIVSFMALTSREEILEEAREFGNSYNYTSADPGADWAVSSASQVSTAYRRVVEGYPVKDTDLGGVVFYDYYRKMHAATMAVYGIGYGLETVASRASAAVEDHKDDPGNAHDDTVLRLHSIAKAHPGLEHLDRVLVGLTSVERLDPNGTRELKASGQMVPYFIAALQTVGSGSPMDNLDMLRRISVGVSKAEGYPADGLPTEDRSGVFRVVRGITAAFDLMYRLVTTSSEHFDVRDGNSAFSYFAEQSDGSFSEYDGGKELYRIVPQFGGSTDVLANHARDLVRRVMDGESFSGERRRSGGVHVTDSGAVVDNPTAKKTIAKSFVLSIDNLTAMADEMLADIPRKSPEDRVELAPQIAEEIELVKAVVREIGDITPQRMFTELLPLYTAMTSRTTGAPQAGSGSLLSLLPGVYDAWSRRVVENDVVSKDLIDALIGANTSPVSNKTVSNRGTAFDVPNSQLRLKNLRYGETPSAAYRRMFREKTPTRPVESAGSDAPLKTDEIADWSASVLGLGSRYTVDAWKELQKSYGDRIDAIRSRLSAAGLPASDADDPRRIMFELALEKNLMSKDKSNRPPCAPTRQKDDRTGAYGYWYPGKRSATGSRRLVDPADAEQGDMSAPLAKLIAKHGSIIVFDTETTGLDTENGQLIQIAAAKYVVDPSTGGVSKEPVDTYVSFVKTVDGSSVPSDASKVNHITDDMLRSAPELKEAMARFMTMLEPVDGKRPLLVAHNAKFDAAMLSMSLSRVTGDPSALDGVDFLDTLTVFRDRASVTTDKIDEKKGLNEWVGSRLGTAVTHYGLEGSFANDHTADGDMKALMAVLLEMFSERDDLHEYVNKFGVTPKYGEPVARIPGVVFVEQPGNAKNIPVTEKALVDVTECAYSQPPCGMYYMARSIDSTRITSRSSAEDSDDVEVTTSPAVPVTQRESPENRPTIDPFVGDGMLAHAAQYLLRPAPSAKVVKNSFGSQAAKDLRDGLVSRGRSISESDVDPQTVRAANTMRALLPWASVEYTGPGTFVVRGRLRSGFSSASGTAANAVITVSVGENEMCPTDEHVLGLAYSPAYASSFVAAKGREFGLNTAADFFRLPLDVRMGLVRRYSVGAAALNRPLWTVDGRGMATLVGAIQIGKSTAGTNLYHEYFHSMIGMFRSLGVFGEEDVRAFRNAFGDPPEGTDMLFNEEAAAERFRRFVKDGTEKDSKVRGVFQRIFDFIKALLSEMARGFRYSTADAADAERKLFSLVISGVAARSDSAMMEADAKRCGQRSQVSFDIASRLDFDQEMSRIPFVVPLKGPKNVRPMAEGDVIGKNVRFASEKAMRQVAEAQLRAGVMWSGATADQVPEELVVDIESAPESVQASGELSAEVVGLLNDPSCGEDRVADAMQRLAAVRGGMAVRQDRYDELTGGPSDASAEYEEMRFAVELGKAPLESFSNPFNYIGRALAEAVQNGLETKGSWAMDKLEKIQRRYTGGATMAARDADVVDKAVIRRAIADLNRTLGESDRIPEDIEDNLVFETLLSMRNHVSSFAADGKDAPGAEAYVRATGGASSLTALKAHASAYDVTAWVLSSSGVSIGDSVSDTVSRMNDYAAKCGPAGKSAIKYYADLLSEVMSAVGDPRSLASYIERNFDEDPFDSIIPRAVCGLQYPGIDADGNIGDYSLTEESAAAEPSDRRPMSVDVGVLKGVIDDPSSVDYTQVQKAMKEAIATIFRAKAMCKFCAETDLVPADPADVAYAHQASGMAVSGQSAEQWCASQAIGNSNFLDNEGLVDYYDQSYFIANNMEQWLASQVRSVFGGVPIGEAFRRDEHEYLGIASEITSAENMDAFLFGDSEVPGQNLLALSVKDRRFSHEFGEIRYGDQSGKSIGVDNYNKKRCTVSLTVDEHRMVDWFKKSVASYIRNQSKMVTGVDRISFVERDFDVDADPRKVEDAIATRSSSVKITQFQWSLYRIMKQVPPVIANDGKDADGNTVKGLYTRFRDAAAEAMSAARDRLNGLRNNVLSGKATADDRAELESFDFNHAVLSALEARGLVVCRRRGSKCTEAVLVQSVDEVDRMFRESTAFAKLTSDARWAGVDSLVGEEHRAEREEFFSRDRMRKRYRALYDRLARFVKEHPWMTGGDVKYMNSFGTKFPFFRGSGLFMANAIRTERDHVQTAGQKMAGYERTALWLCTTKDSMFRLSDIPIGKEQHVAEAAGVLRAMLGVRGMSDSQFVVALVAGEFAPGGKRAGTLEQFGTEISADPSLAELRDVLYRVCLAKTWSEANGAPGEMTTDAAEYVRVYEQSTGASGTMVGGLGMTDEMMYRLHGVLPANYQVGKMVSKAAEQITNVMMHRNTFMSMMLAPSSDGAPVYYMKPSETAAETSGIPDVCWGAVARWWASFHGIPYDESSTGVENASRIYDLLRERGMTDPARHTKTWRLRAGESDHRYVLIDDKDVGLPSVSGILCIEDGDTGGSDSAINSAAGGEAAGYMKQFVWSGRNLGFAGVRAGLHRVMSWSKSLSVSFSFFFPLATRFESPIGAVGAIPTLVGNSRFASGMMRSNPELFNSMQKLFRGSGWITKDFIGVGDVLDLMDSDDPFLAELKSYCHAIGLTLYDTKFNPMEPTKSIVEADVRKLKLVIGRSGIGHQASAQIGEFLDSLVTRSGERAFTYALNAVKLATVAQLTSKLRHEAGIRGKAFDPIRDLRRYSRYLNAEIGGTDERGYAWAHPMFRGMMNVLMFSWPWTRSSWEAGGGAVIEDFVFGGHSMTREERKYLLGRWARMYGEVMIGVPAMMQMIIKAAAVAAGRDDPDDKWFTRQNEDKSKWTAYNITPLMRVLHDHEDVAGLAGRAIGAAVGWSKLGTVGAIAGAVLGDRLVPNYRGDDQGNAKTRNRKYYQHFGKQGWEFFRWFDEPGKQVAGKLSMPVQRILEGLLGRNLGYLDHELPWDDMGPAERWLSLTSDSALFNLAKAFVPFTVTGMTTFGDAGALPMFGPVQMGASQTSVQERLRREIRMWASNDRNGYRWGAMTAGRGRSGRKSMSSMFSTKVGDILSDAKANGLDPDQQLATAVGQVVTEYYARLFRALPKNASDDYDAAELARVCRSLHRLFSSKKRIMQSVKKRYDAVSGGWNGLPPEHRRLMMRVIGDSWANPFSSGAATGPGYADAADAKGGESGIMQY